MATALTLAADGKRRGGRWQRGSLPAGNGESPNSTWQDAMKRAGLVLDHCPDLAPVSSAPREGGRKPHAARSTTRRRTDVVPASLEEPARPAGDPPMAGVAERPEVARIVPAALCPAAHVVHLGGRTEPAVLADREPGQLRCPRRLPARRHRRLTLERRPAVRRAPAGLVGVLRTPPVAARTGQRHVISAAPEPRACSTPPGAGAGARDLAAGRPAGSRPAGGTAPRQ